MGAIYLIRHGQASFGSQDYDQLSATGRQQAVTCGQYLAAKKLRIDYWFSGSLRRQQDTARLALAEINAQTTELRHDLRFDEFDHTTVFARTLPLLDQNDPDVAAFINATSDRLKLFQPVFEKSIRLWIARERWPDMESWQEFFNRVTLAFEDVIATAGAGKNSVVFTSGGAISVVLAQVLTLSPEVAVALNWSLANTSITKILYSGTRRSVGYFNHYSYLQNDADRSLVTFR